MTPEEWAGDLMARLDLGIQTYGQLKERQAIIAAAIREAETAARAEERERIVKKAFSERMPGVRKRRADYETEPTSVDRYWLGYDDAIEDIAAAIRALP